MAKEWLARSIIVLGLALVVSIPFLGHWLPATAQGIVLHARMAEDGGWTPEYLTAQVGVPMHLRLTSDDVTHGFAVGQLNQPAVEVKPGEMTDITLLFTHPGKYTFYCTTWCGVNHWRMRGTIEVTGGAVIQSSVTPPLFQQLGLNLDAPHKSGVIPAQMPSAWRGALLHQAISSEFTSHAYYLSHTPADLWQALRSDVDDQNLTDQDVWDLVAWVWQSNSTSEQRKQGEELFQANCAACHGQGGAGDGVYAGQLAGNPNLPSIDPSMGEHTQRPADFTDPSRMFSASPAQLQGKIIRGGMGTGMPSWGAIFTQDQTWALVAYLWTFQFGSEVNP